MLERGARPDHIDAIVKSLLLASAACVADLAIITAVFRLADVDRKVRLMGYVFLATLPFFIAAHVTTPANLGLLPQALVEPSRGVDLGFGIFIYGAAFFGGILQIYNLGERGLSLRMLIDIDESPRGSLTADELFRGYSHGHGIEWMYERRLAGLLHHGLIHIDGGQVRNSRAGQTAAVRFAQVQAFLRLYSYP